MVTFLNEPKLSEHAADAAFNERRIKLLPILKQFISSHVLFLTKEVEVTFLHAGVSSLVCLIGAVEKKYVLKIPLSMLTSGLEGIFLKAWGGAGIKVPHVFEEGKLGDHCYILMEYLAVNTLIQEHAHEELLKGKTYQKMGSLLRRMHEVKAEGYSNIVNDKMVPEYENVTTWLSGDNRTKEQFLYVKENALLDECAHGSIEEICGIIISRIGAKKETVYCHNDFHAGNIFATDPLTVFDPWPCFHHPYMDTARAIILASKIDLIEVTEQFIDGYFEGENYDRRLLQAFIILNVWVKLPYMHKTNQIDAIEQLKDYLIKTRHFL